MEECWLSKDGFLGKVQYVVLRVFSKVLHGMHTQKHVMKLFAALKCSGSRTLQYLMK